MSKQKIRVLCVDDHNIVLKGLELLLGHESDMVVVGTANTGELALSRFRECRPDVTLMDLQLPGMSGVETIQAIRAEAPDARIVVLTVHQGDDDIYRALDAGAAGYLLKDALADDLIRVIQEVHSGQHSISGDVSARLDARRSMPALTAREIEVLRLIAQGLRNKEIALALGIAGDTAKVHVRHVMSKLGVSDRTATVAIALRRGILHIGKGI